MYAVVASDEGKFPSSFCYVQTPVSNRLFLIEGHSSALKACVELVRLGNEFQPVLRASMNYRRMLASVTAVDEGNLVVSGGLSPSGSKTECYDVGQDKWTCLPELNVGRKAHASCSFNRKLIFVFGGRDDRNTTINVIERLDFNETTQGWHAILIQQQAVQPPASSFPAVYQVNQREICIVGGAKNVRTAHLYNPALNLIKLMHR